MKAGRSRRGGGRARVGGCLLEVKIERLGGELEDLLGKSAQIL